MSRILQQLADLSKWMQQSDLRDPSVQERVIAIAGAIADAGEGLRYAFQGVTERSHVCEILAAGVIAAAESGAKSEEQRFRRVLVLISPM